MQTLQYRKIAFADNRREKFLAHSVLLLMTCSMLEDTLSNILSLMGGNVAVSNYVSWIIYGTMMLYLIWNLLHKRKLINLLVVESFVLIVVYLSISKTPEIAEMVRDNITTIFISNVIAYFVGKYGFIEDAIYKNILSIAPFYINIGVVYSILLLFTKSDNYMNSSYNLLFVVCLCVLKAKSNHQLKYYIIAAALSIHVLLFGASGVFLTIVIFVIVLFFQNLNGTKKMLVMIGGVIIGIFIFLLYDQLLSVLVDMFPNSRTLYKLASANFSETPRFLIWKYAFTYITNNPIKFNGIFADRVIITYGNLTSNSIGQYVSLDLMGGLYAHNIILEIIMQFGGIIGAILIIVFLHRMMKMKKLMCSMHNKVEKNFFCLVTCIALIPLMVSSSYLVSFNFWLLVGMINSGKIHNVYKYKHKQKEV